MKASYILLLISIAEVFSVIPIWDFDSSVKSLVINDNDVHTITVDDRQRMVLLSKQLSKNYKKN